MARYERVAQALRKEISTVIHDELKDPRLGFITVTGIKLTPDLRYAEVFFSVLGKDKDYRKTKEALESALGFIRRLIAQRIKLRFTPEIVFKEDRSCEYSLRIQQVLDEIKDLKNEPRPSYEGEGGTKIGKEGRGEPKKSKRRHKKK